MSTTQTRKTRGSVTDNNLRQLRIDVSESKLVLEEIEEDLGFDFTELSSSGMTLIDMSLGIEHINSYNRTSKQYSTVVYPLDAFRDNNVPSIVFILKNDRWGVCTYLECYKFNTQFEKWEFVNSFRVLSDEQLNYKDEIEFFRLLGREIEKKEEQIADDVFVFDENSVDEIGIENTNYQIIENIPDVATEIIEFCKEKKQSITKIHRFLQDEKNITVNREELKTFLAVIVERGQLEQPSKNFYQLPVQQEIEVEEVEKVEEIKTSEDTTE